MTQAEKDIEKLACLAAIQAARREHDKQRHDQDESKKRDILDKDAK